MARHFDGQHAREAGNDGGYEIDVTSASLSKGSSLEQASS